MAEFESILEATEFIEERAQEYISEPVNRLAEMVYMDAKIKRLEAANADLLAACEAALVEINKIMHACFVSGSYRGRMRDIGGAADSARRILSEARPADEAT